MMAVGTQFNNGALLAGQLAVMKNRGHRYRRVLWLRNDREFILTRLGALVFGSYAGAGFPR